MQIISTLLPLMLQAVAETIEANSSEVTLLDQELGDGDHVINLQRGIAALLQQQDTFAKLDWGPALHKIGMTLLSKMGGASGSLYGTLFMSLGKSLGSQPLTQETFAEAFMQAVEAVKKRGKSDAGEKTMLDVLIPVSAFLHQARADSTSLTETLESLAKIAISGMLATKDMKATKGRASFLGDRSLGHIDAGAKTSQLIVCAIAAVLLESSTPA